MHDRPRPTARVHRWESRTELALQQRIDGGGDACLFYLQGGNGGSELLLIGDHLVHCRLLRGDRLLLGGNGGGESGLGGVEERDLLVERRFLLCGSNAQLLCFGPIGTNLIFNRREASRISANAIGKLHIFRSESVEPGDVEQDVSEALTGEQDPERWCLVGDIRLANARGQD